MNDDMKFITYKGNCDVIRTAIGFHWKEFSGDGIELIVGKKYEIISSCCMQWVYIKKDGEFVKDFSGERYLYWKIENEQNEEIYVWEGFFQENTNL